MISVKVAGYVIDGGPYICENYCPTEKRAEEVPPSSGLMLR